MQNQKRLWLLITMTLFGLLLVGCGAPTSTSQSATAIATPGIGVPVAGGRWQVTVTDARREYKWSDYTPKSGFAFLVTDITFQNLDTTQETLIATKEVAVITEAGEVIIAGGFAIPANSHIDTMNGKEAPNITSGTGFLPTLGSKEDSLSVTLVFPVPDNTINKVFKLQFQEVPFIPFSITRTT